MTSPAPVHRSRPAIATVAGIAFVLVYVVAAITVPDVLPQHWAVQALYFLLAGVLWVLPVRWLMLWSVGKR